MSRCANDCFDAVARIATPEYYSLDVARNVTLAYRSSQASPTGFVQLEVLDVSSTPASKVSIRLKRADGSYVAFRGGATELFFTRKTGYMLIAVQFDASALATGPHDYTAVVTSYWSGSTLQSTKPVRVLVVNEVDSPYGRGWQIAGHQRFYRLSNGNAAIIDGNGGIAHFTATGCVYKVTGKECYFTSPPGDFSTLVFHYSNDSFVRTYADGTRYRFTGCCRGNLAWVEDRFGNRTSYAYDASQRLTRITDPIGKVITLTYGANGRLSTITDPGSPARTTTFTINASNQLVTTVNPASHTTRFAYDGSGRMTRFTDARGSVFDYAYDFAGKLRQIQAPSVSVDNLGLVRPTTTLTSLESLVLTASGATSTLPASPARADTLRAVVVSARGHATKLKLDKYGSPLRVEEPLGRITTMDWNAGRLEGVVRPSGGRTYYTWVGGDLTRVYDSNTGHTINIEYEATFHEPFHVYGDVQERWYTWSNGMLQSSQEGSTTAPLTTYTYDSRGRVKSSGDPENHSISYTYEATGFQNLLTMSKSGGTTTYTSDGFGRLTTVSNPFGEVQRTAFDVINRDTALVEHGGATTHYAYDALFLTGVTDAKGQQYGFVRNALGWVERQIDPNNQASTARFDASGNVVAAVSRGGRTVTYAYDALEQLVGITADGSTTTLAYDPAGRYTAATNAESVDTLKFDVAGRPASEISVINGVRYERTSTHDRRNLRTALAITAPWSASIGFGYNSKLQLASVTDVSGRTTTLTYDHDQLATGFSLPNGVTIRSGHPSTHTQGGVEYSSTANPTLNDQLGVRFGYDAVGRIQERVAPDDASGVEYKYDAHGRLKSVAAFEYASGGACTPVYEQVLPDPDAEPIRYDCPPDGKDYGQTSTFTYDQVGNPDLAATVDWGNRLRAFRGYLMDYDVDGNLVRKYWGADSTVLNQRFAWNSLGQLVSVVTLRNGSASTVQFGYDALGRRVRKEDPTGVRRYLYDGADLFAELDGAGNPVAEYTYYPGIDRPLMVRRATGDVLYFTTESPGNVTGLLSTSGALVNQYRYGPFGDAQLKTESVENPLQFGAREYDTETGLYFNRARYYDPVLRRFISEDPMGLGGGINLYVYVNNNPVNAADPLGLSCDLVNSVTGDYVGEASEGQIYSGGDGNMYQCSGGGWVPYDGGSNEDVPNGGGTPATDPPAEDEQDVGEEAEKQCEAAGSSAAGSFATDLGLLWGARGVQKSIGGVPRVGRVDIWMGALAAANRKGLIWAAEGTASYVAGVHFGQPQSNWSYVPVIGSFEKLMTTIQKCFYPGEY